MSSVAFVGVCSLSHAKCFPVNLLMPLLVLNPKHATHRKPPLCTYMWHFSANTIEFPFPGAAALMRVLSCLLSECSLSLWKDVVSAQRVFALNHVTECSPPPPPVFILCT